MILPNRDPRRQNEPTPGPSNTLWAYLDPPWPSSTGYRLVPLAGMVSESPGMAERRQQEVVRVVRQ